MKAAIILALTLLASTASAAKFDFAQFKTCKDCVGAGFGWCSIQRICGGFANRHCGDGERYHRNDYTPPPDWANGEAPTKNNNNNDEL